MSPATDPAPASCYDCGRDLPAGAPQVPACLWKSPAAGGPEHWARVEVCPACARRRALWEGVPLAALVVAAAIAAFAVGCQFLP